MSGIKSRVLRAVKPTLRNALWKALLRVDDSLGFSAPARVNHVAPATPAPSRPIETMGFAAAAPSLTTTTPPAIVLNQDGIVTTPEALRLVFECIFETPALGGLEAELFERVAARPELWADHARVVLFLREQLIARLEKSTGDKRSAAAQALYQLSEHERKTAESGRAYSPVGRNSPGAVFWPDPTRAKDPRSIFDDLPYAVSHELIDKSVPIGSAGSCFAMEIAHRLQSDGFNYVITEPVPTPPHGYSNACARWGTIFNTPSFRQLVERAFAGRPRSPVLWSMVVDGKQELRDPYREDVTFASMEEFEADWSTHQAAIREALLRCKVFVLTLGVNEVWRLKSDGSVFSRAPWRIAANLVETQVLTVEDNLCELQAMLDLWRRYNPGLQIVVSVSPVPLHATFRADDYHVITANTHSKATLRVVAEEFARRNRDVYYFPSYEVVMSCTREAWDADQRHVSRNAVDKVMKLFNRMFLRSDARAELGDPLQLAHAAKA